MSSRKKKLPDPLLYKIRSWDLPRDVLISFYRFVLEKVDQFPLSSAQTIVRTYEFTASSQTTGMEYCFAGRIAAREYKGEPTLVDIDFDYFCR